MLTAETTIPKYPGPGPAESLVMDSEDNYKFCIVGPSPRVFGAKPNVLGRPGTPASSDQDPKPIPTPSPAVSRSCNGVTSARPRMHLRSSIERPVSTTCSRDCLKSDVSRDHLFH
ncbi:hypothetical protein BS47DRAFT_1335321 [Hydnum rufescens UP504]|uniref:Uncharacterized protein n=1 Tax=Hydnum rufescens UP504 TaxID=1448309 RepID=A0A9P6BCK0_9AGAM|nr:hypothetical protein BS47DRAFT_1335321 [Hydnum rufescens UP504]